MSEDSLISSLMPVFSDPIIDGYKEIRKEMLQKEQWYKETKNPNTVEDHSEIQLRIDRIESEWGKRPQNFASIDSANGYFSHVESTINSVTSCMSEIIKKDFHKQRKAYVNFNDSDGIYHWIELLSAWGAAAAVISAVYNQYKEMHEDMWWAVAAFIVGLLVSNWILYIIDFPFRKIRAIKFDKKNPEIQPWIMVINNNIEALLNRIEKAKPEIYADIEHTKKLMRSIKEKMVDGHFEDLRDKRTMMARMEMIKAEMEATIATARNLEEQHRLTEEMRLKYATELIDLERQVKAENNQDLADKLAQVQDILQD